MIGAEGVSPVSCASCRFICRQLADLDGSSASPQAGVIRATVYSTSELCSALEEDLDLPSNCATEREPQECGVWFDRWSLPRGGDGWVSVGLVRRGGVLHVRRYASVAWSPGGGLLRGWALFCHSSSFLPIPSLSDAGALRVSPTVPLLLTEPWWSSPQYGATSSDGATLFLPEMQPSRAYFGRAYPYGRLPIEALLATPLSRTNLVGSDIPRKSGVLDKGVSILPKFLMLAPVPLTGLWTRAMGAGPPPPTLPGTQITPTHQTQNTSSPLGDQGDERTPHPGATSSAGAPRDKQPPIRLTLTRTQRDTGETKMSQEDSKTPLGSGTSHPPPQHAPPPGRTYINPIPEIGSKITQILKLRADFGEHRQCLLTNHILSPPGPQDISRQITRFLRQRSYYKHVLTPAPYKPQEAMDPAHPLQDPQTRASRNHIWSDTQPQVPPTTGPAKGEQPPPTKPKQPPHPTPSPASLTLQQGKQKNPQAPPRQIALTAAKPQKPTQTPRTAKSKAPSNTKKGPPPKAVVKSEPATQLKTHRQAPAPLLSTKQGPPVKRVSFTTQRSPLEDPSDSTSSSSSSEDADESEEEKTQSEEKGAQDETDSTAEGDEGSPKRDGKDQNAEVLQATLHPPPRIVTVGRRKIHISSEFTPAARDHEPQRTMRLPTPSHRQPPGKGGKPLGPKRQQPPREPHVDIHTQVGGKRKSTATTQPSKEPLPTGNTCNRRGIHNPGTMCWIITTMQALASTRDLPQTVQAWTRQQRLPQSGSPQHTLHLISNTLTTLTPKRGMGTWAPLRVPWLGDATALSHLHPTFKPGHPGTIHKAIKDIGAQDGVLELEATDAPEAITDIHPNKQIL
eukprot:g39070.t1